MLNTTKAFIFSLFELFIVYIVLGNFLGWSGGAVAMTGYDVDWQNSYIGFESFSIAIADFDKYREINWYFTSVSNFLDWSKELIDTATFGIPGLIIKFANGSSLSALEWLVFFFKLLAQPIMVTLYVILLLGCILSYMFGFMLIVFRFVGGAYNLHSTDTIDVWNQWSYLSSEWDWSSLISGSVI